MADSDDHQFNRRSSDANVMALAFRMGVMETRVEVLELQSTELKREMGANTKLTSQVHEAVYGRDEEKGLQAKVADMHEVFTTASKGFEYIGKSGDLLERALAKGEKIAKPVVWIAAAIAGFVWWWKTGEFKWPEWMPK